MSEQRSGRQVITDVGVFSVTPPGGAKKQLRDWVGEIDDAVNAADGQLAAHVAGAEAARDTATAQAVAAGAAKTSAETARDAANAMGKVYPDTASGIAGVADGAYFSVPAAGSSESLILYRRSGAAATEVKRYPTADAALKPTWTGRYNGWPDPFFRKFDLSSATWLGRNRWYSNASGGTSVFAGWTRVASASPFDGYVLRRTTGYNTTTLSGPGIWLDEIGAAPGDTVTAYMLVVGGGGAVYSGYRFDNGTASVAYGTPGSMVSSTGAISVTASATPQWLRISATVPASAVRMSLYPYNASGSNTFDVVAVWAFKGAAADGPDWPTAGMENYYRLRDVDLTSVQAAPEIVLPPTLYTTVGREFNVYLDNVTPSADARDFAWDVSTPLLTTVAKQQSERWTYFPEGGHASVTFTLSALRKTDGSTLAAGSSAVIAAAASAGTGSTPKCIFIGDSLTAAGTFTQELLTIDATDAMGIALYGTQGSGANKHEGRGGWKVDNYVTDFTDTSARHNPFWIAGALNFPQYLTDNAIPVPDWVFVMLGTNDVFNATTDAAAEALAATELAKLDTLIASIKAAGASVKVGVMTSPPPSFEQDAFGENYFAGQTRWRFKRNILLWDKAVIARYSGQTANRIFIVPTHVNLDTVNNMSRAASAPVNARSTVTAQRQSNGVHPATEGYYQIADTVWAFLKNNV
jgi:lysophospholipase L1-like esterase